MTLNELRLRLRLPNDCVAIEFRGHSTNHRNQWGCCTGSTHYEHQGTPALLLERRVDRWLHALSLQKAISYDIARIRDDTDDSSWSSGKFLPEGFLTGMEQSHVGFIYDGHGWSALTIVP